MEFKLDCASFFIFKAVCSFYRTVKKTVITLAGIWIFNCSSSVPVLLVSQEALHFDLGQERSYCIQAYPGQTRKIHNLLIFLAYYCIPLIIIGLCYYFINNTIKKHKEGLSFRIKESKSKKRITKLVFIVVVTFALCWFPIHCVHFISEFVQPRKTFALYVFKIVAHCFSYVNSALNPIIYSFMSDSFKECVKNSFCFHDQEAGELASDNNNSSPRLEHSPCIQRAASRNRLMARSSSDMSNVLVKYDRSNGKITISTDGSRSPLL